MAFKSREKERAKGMKVFEGKKLVPDLGTGRKPEKGFKER